MAAVGLTFAILGAGIAVARSAAPVLPRVQADALLARVRAAVENPPAMTGLIESRIATGMPIDSLPGGLQGALRSTEGAHRLRVWRSGDSYRLAEMRDDAETDEYVVGRSAWLWASDPPSATALPPTHASDTVADELSGAAIISGRPSLSDPVDATRMALSGLAISSTRIDGTDRIAGRSAYRLIVNADPSRTLVSRIEIAVDALTSTPLRIEVDGRDGVPAIEAVYRTVRFGKVDARAFAFTPPPYAQDAPQPDRFSRRLSQNFKRTGAGLQVAFTVAVPTILLQQLSGRIDYAALFPFNGALVSGRLTVRGSITIIAFGTVPQQVLETIAVQDADRLAVPA